MTGPIFDTLIMCTLTAVIILISGVYQTSDSQVLLLLLKHSYNFRPSWTHNLIRLCCEFGLSTILLTPIMGRLVQSFFLVKRA